MSYNSLSLINAHISEWRYSLVCLDMFITNYVSTHPHKTLRGFCFHTVFSPCHAPAGLIPHNTCSYYTQQLWVPSATPVPTDSQSALCPSQTWFPLLYMNSIYRMVPPLMDILIGNGSPSRVQTIGRKWVPLHTSVQALLSPSVLSHTVPVNNFSRVHTIFDSTVFCMYKNCMYICFYILNRISYERFTINKTQLQSRSKYQES